MNSAPRLCTAAGPTVGFIGIGSMGAPMARNLAVDGTHVLVHDLDPDRARPLLCDSIEWVDSPATMARRSELIVSMVWDDAALESTVFGSRGILAVEEFGGCLVDLSTTSVSGSLRVAAALGRHGAGFLDGGVIGGGALAARAGRSPIVLAGARELFDRHAAVLRRLGSCDYVGRQGLAKLVKVLNNLLVGVVTAANAEALSLGVAAGVRLPEMVRALSESPVASTVLRSYMNGYVRDRQYGQGLIGHTLMAKDLSLACKLADELAAPGLFAGLARQLYLQLARDMGGDLPFPSAFDYFTRTGRTAV